MNSFAIPTADAAVPATSTGAGRFAMLDGWRAVSILLVLAGHLLPIGPKRWELNGAVAVTGMVVFFTLSGFLITRFLAEGAELRAFLIRRFFRIVPLAWLVMVAVLAVTRVPAAWWPANLLFYANLPPQRLPDGGGHLWSLCVEMQFYVAIALFVALAGRRALIVLPAAALGVTMLRVAAHDYVDIVTLFRVDEILAGGTLALAYAGKYGEGVQRVIAWASTWWLFPLLLVSAHPWSGPLNYLRPYLSAMMVGSTLYRAPPLLRRLFETPLVAWVASISYALYIIHGALAATWLGSGPVLVKYAKRPLLFAATFVLAHLSTYRFEQPCIGLAKRITRGHSIRLGR